MIGSKGPPTAPKKPERAKPIPEESTEASQQAPQDPAQLIRATYQRCETRRAGGAWTGIHRLTPAEVTLVGYGERYGKPGLLEEQGQVKVNVRAGAVAFQTTSWDGGITTGIYAGGLKFPEFCCTCVKPALRHELVEILAHKHGGALTSMGDAETAGRLINAMQNDRFWFAIPFCNEHGLDSGSIGFDTGNPAVDKVTLGFTNREYAKRLCELNGLSGVWLDRTSMIARNVVVWIALSSPSVTLFSGASILNEVRGDGEPFVSMPTGIGLLIGSVLAFVVSLRHWIKYRKGQPLNESSS